MGVLELAGVKAELAKAVKSGVMRPLAIGTGKDVAGLIAVGVAIPIPVTARELVTAKGFDSADSFRDFHGSLGLLSI